jgi:hypothetical protein
MYMRVYPATAASQNGASTYRCTTVKHTVCDAGVIESIVMYQRLPVATSVLGDYAKTAQGILY